MIRQTFPEARPLVPLWYEDQRARVLLASIAKHHPTCEVRFDTYVTSRDEWAVYVGYRVECLDRIYAEHWRTARADGEREFNRFLRQPTVQAIVAAAIEPSRIATVVLPMLQQEAA